jgi:hypothetical protein
MDKKYSLYLSGRTFKIKNWEADEGVYAEVTLANPDKTFVYPVVGRIKHKNEDMTVRQAALFLIDYIDTYFEEYWQEDEDLYIPIDWTNFEYDAVDFQLRGQVLNEKVESMADELLAGGEAYKGPNIIF